MPESFDEAFPGGFDECVRTLGNEDSVDDPQKLCGWLKENGFETIQSENPESVLSSLSVEYVSVVDEPAQNSEWLVAKSANVEADEFDPDDDSLRDGEFVVDKQTADDADDPDRKVWAAVLIPDEVDKQGDLVPRPEIESAAHEYLKHYRKVDEDHDLIDGSGEPIESYVLKQETSFDMPDGSTERTYPPGTWIMGVELTPDAWKRVESGELTGFSIYGGAANHSPSTLLTDEQKDTLLSLQKNDEDTVEKQPDDDPCWDGYVMVGTKEDEFGNEVPRCVPEEDASKIREEYENMQNQEKEVDPEDLMAAVEAWSEATGGDPSDATATELLEWVQENPDYGEDDGEEPEADMYETDNNSDGETMSNDDANDSEQNAKLDELLEKTNSVQESVEDTRKSVESVQDRVDDLEQEVFEKTEQGGEGESSDLSEPDVEDVEDVAAESAETAAKEVLKDAFGVDDDDTDDEAEIGDIVRKGNRFPDPDHESTDENELTLDYSGVVGE